MSENLMIGLTLLCLGMGFVLAFLCIQIVVMHGMSAVVQWLNKIFPEEVEVVEKKKSVSKSDDDSAAVALAIAAVMTKK